MEKRTNYDILREITIIPCLLAVAIVADRFLKIGWNINGGSINIATLILALIAYRFGVVKGFIAAGIVFGLTTCLLDGYGFPTYPLDYLVAFGSISVIGFVNKRRSNSMKDRVFQYLFIFLAFSLHMIIRLIASTIDGMLFYSTGFVASLTYNLSYIWPTVLIAFVLFIAILPGFEMATKMKVFSINNNDETAQESETEVNQLG